MNQVRQEDKWHGLVESKVDSKITALVTMEKQEKPYRDPKHMESGLGVQAYQVLYH